MAGKPGMKGGGGARKGSGRKPSALSIEIASIPGDADPKAFLLGIMGDESADPRARIDAAKTLMPFCHVKLGEGGKKDLKADAAKTAGAGRFGASAPPKLVVNNGR